jgi:carbon storage regulator
MLVLSRRIGETLMVGDDVAITFLNVNRNQIKIGIEAPKDIAIHRKEIFLKIQEEKLNQE